MKRKITKTVVDNTHPENCDVFVWDTEIRGFAVKVTPSGKKQYVFQYRMGGRGHPTRRYTIGPHGAFTPDKARRAALDLRAQVSKGIDPGKAKSEVREKLQAAGPVGFGQLAATYVERECPALARGTDVASVIRREILPHWAAIPATELRKRDAITLTDALLDAGRPAAALELYEVIKRVGNWLVERDELEVSPFANLKPPASKVVRDHVLSREETSCLWSACNQIDYPFGPLVQLLLLTGQRRNEVAGMRWSEIDLGAVEWIIPSHRSKNDKPHLVPLTVPILSILESLPRFDGPYVFTTTSGKRPVSGFSKAKARLDRLMVAVMEDKELAGAEGAGSTVDVEPWRLHDLRRTMRTGMAALGVPEIVSEKVLNHQPNVLTRTYNVHAYDAEKREALERWVRYVMDVVTPPPATVVRMSRPS